MHPFETIPTNKLKEIYTYLEKPLLLTERIGIAIGREQDERRVQSRNTLHVDTECLPGIR
jgi:hypothetical protein